MDQNIKLVLKYLKEHDFIEAYLTLERESEVRYVTYSKEIEFFKKIMLKGDFTQAISFVSTFENRLDEKDLRKIALEIYKQKLYELINEPDEEQLKSLFQRQLVNYCTEEEFQQFFGYLSLRQVHEIEGMEGWSVVKGRYECFQSVISYLELFNSVVHNQPIGDKLEDIIEVYYSRGQEKFHKSHFNSKKGSQSPSQKQLSKQQGSEKEKETIKNSIIRMNLSSNYSNIRSQILPNNNRRANPSPEAEVEGRKEKLMSGVGENRSIIQKNVSALNVPAPEDNSVFPEKKAKGNFNHSESITRQKLQSSNVKIDNFFKNDSKSYLQMDNSIKPPIINNNPLSKHDKPDKSQVLTDSNLYPSVLSKSKQYANPSKLIPVATHELQSSRLKDIYQQQQRNESKLVYPVGQKQSLVYKSKHSDEELEEEVKKNIEYLEQTSSVVFKPKEDIQESYTFSNCQDRQQRVTNLVKLAVITDSKAIRTCQFSSSGNYFAVGTNSSVLKLFDVQRLFAKSALQQLLPIYQIDNLHLKSIFCLAWTNNERSLATCSNDLQIKLTDINKGFTEHKTTVIGKHESCIRMVRFNQAQTRLISCGDDSTIKVWDLGKTKKCTNLKNHTSSVSAIKIHNDNELYSVSKDLTIRKWDLRVCENVTTSKIQDSELTFIANNTNRIIVSHKDGSVSFFNHSLVMQHAVKIHDEEIRSVQALKGEQTLLTASFDGHVALFTQRSAHSPNYFQHNDSGDDKVVFATFLHSPHYRGFSSTSTQGLCHIYSYL